MCCLPPSHPQRITKNTRGVRSFGCFSKKKHIFFRGGFHQKSLPKEKCFLLQNMALPPPPRPTSLTMNKQQNRRANKEPSKFFSQCFIWLNLEFGNLGYFGLVLAVIGHSVPLRNFLGYYRLCFGHFLTMCPTGSITSKNNGGGGQTPNGRLP